MNKKSVCSICGAELTLGHNLLAHGPLAPKDVSRRRRVRRKLPELHRRLEEKGFTEYQAHIILQTVKEVFRNTGII